MKLCKSEDKTLSFHVKMFLLPKSKPRYCVFASEIYHCNILLKVKRKSGKNLIDGKNIYLQHFPFKMIYQARKIQLNIWSSEDDQDTKSGRPQARVVVLKCIPFAGQ